MTTKPYQPRGITVSVRADYPEEGEYSWTEALLPFTSVGAVEVAFHKTQLFLDKVQIHDVIAPFSKLPLKAASVHMAHAKITKPETFVAALEKTVRIAEALNCSVIVVHPSYGSLRGRLQEVNAFFAQMIDPLLKAANVTLCWETFSGKRRFLSGIEGIAAFCEGRQWHHACYDTSHLHKPNRDVIADIKSYTPIIKSFHLSNRSQDGKQHLPLRHPDGVLDFKEIVRAIIESEFSGPLTLEYLKEYQGCLLEDAQWLKGQIGERGLEDRCEL